MIIRTYNKAKLVVIAIAFVAVAGSGAYELMWVLPKQRCEAKGGLWASKWMRCSQLVTLESLTGRPSHPGLDAPAVPVAAPAPAAPAAH